MPFRFFGCNLNCPQTVLEGQVNRGYIYLLINKMGYSNAGRRKQRNLNEYLKSFKNKL
jgi:hypothetical protein